MPLHTYDLTITWTGNRGAGTTGIKDYDRDHTVDADGPPTILGTSEPSFLGDPARWNPEQLFVASISQCHMLWYLGLCASTGVVVQEYVDHAVGTLTNERGEVARFTEVVLRPRIVVESPDMIDKAIALHDQAHEKCFIAQSVSCDVRHEPEVTAR